MSRGNKGVALVLGGGIAAGLAIALFFFFYWIPRQRAGEARAEVEHWGKRWLKARQCLIGEPPTAADPIPAVLAREASQSNMYFRYSGCQEAINDLHRPEGFSTENPDLETAWRDMREAMIELGEAHLWRTAKQPRRTLHELRVRLGETIAGMDEAYSVLRRAAGMSNFVPAGPEAPVELVPRRTLAVSEPTEMASWRQNLYFTGRLDDWLQRVELSPTGVRHTPLSPGAVRAGLGPWGAWLQDESGQPVGAQGTGNERLVAGVLDAAGDPVEGGVQLGALAALGLEPREISLAFVIGGVRRFVAIEQELEDPTRPRATRLVVLESADEGKSWQPVDLPAIDVWQLWLAPDGQSAALLSLGGEPSHWITFSKDGVHDEPLRFDQGLVHSICVATEATWFFGDDAVYRLGKDGLAAVLRGPGAWSFGHARCDDLALVVFGNAPAEYAGEDVLSVQRCAIKGCASARIPLPSDGNYGVTVDNGRARIVSEVSGMLVDWKLAEGPVPRVVGQMPENSMLHDLVVQDGGLKVVAATESQGLFFLAVPE